jgi:transcriptional regulator with XRE-family HTH domain
VWGRHACIVRQTGRHDKGPVLPMTVRATLRLRLRNHQAMAVVHDELGGCLRSWRERLTPGDAGLPVGRQRRVPGLRREELARLAGVSPDYLARLEQGRARRPSAPVLASLARALRLTGEERAHLYRLAGAVEPGSGAINREVTPSLRRLLDRLADVPVVVVDVAGETVAANALAIALMGDLSSASRRERTLAWRHFAGLPSRSVRNAEEQAAISATIVAELHDALGRYPADEYLTGLIEELIDASPRFAELWQRHPVARAQSRRKIFQHPDVGTITLDSDTLTVAGSDLQVIVYTAPAGSSDAESLVAIGAKSRD